MIRTYFFAALVAASSCRAQEHDVWSNDPTAKNYQAPQMPRAKVLLEDAFGGKHVVEVEVAATGPLRQRGMMWRTELAEGKGMLFLFNADQLHSFWMQNTLIPLDIIFLAADGTVVGVVENAQPRTTTSRSIGSPSRNVLEVPGGWSRKISLKMGSKAELVGTGAIPIED